MSNNDFKKTYDTVLQICFVGNIAVIVILVILAITLL